MTKTKILFDESHDELLRSQKIPDDDEVDTWSKLGAALTEIGYEAIPHTTNGTGEEHLTKELLGGYEVLVLAAPKKPLTNAEVEAIANFVHQGGSLLIAQSYWSLWDQDTTTINLLLEKFGLRTKRPPDHVSIEPIGQTQTNHWRLTALDEGDWKINLEVAELDQSITRLIRAYPPIQKRIHEIERDIVIPLTAEVHHQVSQLRKELASRTIQKIPFRLLTPEDQVRLVEPPDVREDLLEVLQAARKEKDTNRPLLQQILLNISPIYSPVHGCCIPYDPKLAKSLVEIRKHSAYEENLAYNFMSIEGEERYGQTWLKQNLAALLLHEKYGHGFFFTETKLGKQLAILARHGLVPGTNSKQLRSPYPRSLYNDYEEVITLIYHSAIIVNEGFATWLEQIILPRLSELIGQAAYRRRDFLFYRDSSMADLAQDSEYFQKSQPQRVSKYREGCEYLELIQGYFGTNWGPKCAVQAMMKATEIDLGITESHGQVRFGLEANQMKAALLDEQSKDAQSDERLRVIHDILREHTEEIIEKQEKLQCHRTCLHSECPINGIIRAKLGW